MLTFPLTRCLDGRKGDPLPPDDESLIRDVLGGRQEAFDELMHRYERLVYKVAWGFGKSTEDALDITQTVFMKVYRSLDSFRTEANFKTWLLRITYNEGINWVRSHGRTASREVVAIENDDVAATDDPEADLLARDRRKSIEAGLRRLNERYRTALVLRYFQGLPIREIASVLSCSETMTKNILFRGVRRLRQEIGESV